MIGPHGYDLKPAPAYTIYALLDVRDLTIRYVGCSGGGHAAVYNRLSGHLAGRKRNSAHGRWMRSLFESGHRPVAVTVEIGFDKEDAPGAERYWIAKLREQGHPLTNKLDGGYCLKPRRILPSRRYTKEQSERLSASRKLHWKIGPEAEAKTEGVLERIRVKS